VVEDDTPTVLFVTALDVETKAILRHVGDDWTDEEVDGTVYYRGKFEDWDVVIVEAGPGNTSTAVLASLAAAHFKPDVSLFVGVGGGIKDVKLGDVVVATKVYGYESGKDTSGEFKARPDLDRGAHPLTIQTEKVIYPHTLETGSVAEIDQVILEFFNRLYDTTGHARPNGLFHFPPGPPRP
jgi:nucleoside phosphorylase